MRLQMRVIPRLAKRAEGPPSRRLRYASNGGCQSGVVAIPLRKPATAASHALCFFDEAKSSQGSKKSLHLVRQTCNIWTWPTNLLLRSCDDVETERNKSWDKPNRD